MTLNELTEAIRQHSDTEMDAEVASGMAEHALGFFGFYDRITMDPPGSQSCCHAAVAAVSPKD